MTFLYQPPANFPEPIYTFLSRNMKVKRGVQLKFGEKNSLNPPRSLVICAEDSLIALPVHVLVESDNTHPDVSPPPFLKTFFPAGCFLCRI